MGFALFGFLIAALIGHAESGNLDYFAPGIDVPAVEQAE